MAKNFKAIYEGGNDASAMNQTFFLKKETTRGTIIAATGSDFLYTLSGGGVNFTQPFELSPHRSGRHANNIIRQKTSSEWSLQTFVNIAQKQASPNETKDSLYTTSGVDVAIQTLWEAMLGKAYDLQMDGTTPTGDDTDGGIRRYTPEADPAITFTLFENLDHMAKQAVGCFVNQVELSMPGDGQAQMNWSGNAKTVYHAGIGKVKAIVANEIELDDVDEARRFDVGAMVMVVTSDGVTRRVGTTTVTASDWTTGKVTVAAAPAATAAGDFLCYFEPATQTGIDNPQTGLIGEITIASLPTLSCVRSATLTLNNNHELVDYCFGTDGLSGPLFVPGGRLEATLSIELNLNANLVEFMKRVRELEAQDITLRVGPKQSGTPTIVENKHHLLVKCPKVQFNVPAISVPESGSIPVSFEGTCLQTALDEADEVTVEYQLPMKLT